MLRTWFTSDTHFGHTNIIKYSNRPFANAAEMDNALIHNWNSLVAHNDTVYHLGDFAVGGGPALPYFHRLNGKIFFCWGNHDNRVKEILETAYKRHGLAQINIIDSLREITVEGQRIVLCHYAMKVWNKSHKGAWQLYGHSHGSLPDDPNLLSCDVGVDCWNYFPVSMDQLRAKMKTKTYVPVDHHGEHTT